MHARRRGAGTSGHSDAVMVVEQEKRSWRGWLVRARRRSKRSSRKLTQAPMHHVTALIPAGLGFHRATLRRSASVPRWTTAAIDSRHEMGMALSHTCSTADVAAPAAGA
jgi:hypothetical protein